MNQTKQTKSFWKNEALKKYGLIAYFSFFPALLLNSFWGWMFTSGKSHAWDGTGHYGIAQVYRKTIFPDVFGWMPNYFEGMAFPNYYPPLFYWLVALLTQIMPFDTAFKILITVPMLLIPGLIWLLAWKVNGKNLYAASLSVVGLIVLLIDPRSNGSENFPSGLDYHSTYIIGLYSQPLGFVLLLGWYILFRKTDHSKARFLGASLCLSLAVLANVFTVFLVALITAAVLVVDLIKYFKEKDLKNRGELARRFKSHIGSLLLSAGLTAFWIIPLLSTYKYVVTLPFEVLPMSDFLFIWYGISAIGCIYWLSTRKADAFYYCTFCILLALLIFIFPSSSLPFLPIQGHRIWSSFNFLLAIPFGIGLVFIIKCLFLYPFLKFEKIKKRLLAAAPVALAIWIILFSAAGYLYTTVPVARLYTRYIKATSFYPFISPDESLPKPRQERPGERDLGGLSEKGVSDTEQDAREGIEDIEQVLRFAADKKDQPFLVTFGDLSSNDEARALNHYLGAQGNKVFLNVFREASINSLFMYPQANAFTKTPDSFGISSVLSDDLGFSEQNLDAHLQRIRYLGGKFIVTNIKDLQLKLDSNSLVKKSADCGHWFIFEILNDSLPTAFSPSYKPALIFTDFTVKRRKDAAGNYIRYAEEQFYSGDFDVNLAHLPGSKPEDFADIPDLDGFGTIILDKYECVDCSKAQQVLKDFSKNNLLILLESDSPLFNSIRQNIGDYPKAVIIARQEKEQGKWINTNDTEIKSRFDDNAARGQWSEIRKLLNERKIAIPKADPEANAEGEKIVINLKNSSGGAAPVIVRNTFHPNWQRTDQKNVYITTPARILIFADVSAELVFRRRFFDYIGILISLVSVFALGFYFLKSGTSKQPTKGAPQKN